MSRMDLRKCFFSERVVNQWNDPATGQPQLSMQRRDYTCFESSRQASARKCAVLQASRPHLKEDHLLPGAVASNNLPDNLIATLNDRSVV